jgi:hypothetical protein
MAYSTATIKAITAQNQFSEWVRVNSKQGFANSFSAFMENDSSLVATWVVQARRRVSENSDGTVTYGTTIEINSATVEGIFTAQLVGPWEVRTGVKTGGFTSGSGTVGIVYA